MLRGIIILIISAACIRSNAQSGFEDSLLILEKQIFQASDQKTKQQFLLQKFQLYIHHNEFCEEGLRVAERVDSEKLDSESDELFQWNAALYSYLLLNYEKAYNHLSDYNAIKGSRGVDQNLLGFLITIQLDTTRSNAYLKELVRIDTAFHELSCIKGVQDFEGINPGPYELSSAIVPGSGMIFHGKVGKGMVSLGIHGGIALAVVAMARWNVYFNAVSWGLTFFQKFYFGNLKLTHKLIERSNQKKKEKLATDCELSLDQILQKYPLNFK